MRGFKWSSSSKKLDAPNDDNNNSNGNGNNVGFANDSMHTLRSNMTSTKRKSTYMASARFSKSSDHIESSHAQNHANDITPHLSYEDITPTKKCTPPPVMPLLQQPTGSNTSNYGRTLSNIKEGTPNVSRTDKDARQNNKASTVVVTLDNDNYDTTTFKIGWLNKSNGQYYSNATHSSGRRGSNVGSTGSYSAIGSPLVFKNEDNSKNKKMGGNVESIALDSTHTQSNSIDNNSIDKNSIDNNNNSINSVTTITTNIIPDNSNVLIPDYRIYRAQLKGSILTLYKGALPNSVKFFDPLLSEDINLENNKPNTNSQIDTNSNDSGNNNNNNNKENVPPKYLTDTFPHPELKIDKAGKVISGSLESLCHTILFQNNTNRNIINLILILPLLENFNKFLSCFIQYTRLMIGKHPAIIAERISLLVKTVIDILPSFLLLEGSFQDLISLATLIKQDNLRNMLQEKYQQLNILTSFKNINQVKTQDLKFLRVDDFLNDLDVESFANSFHLINLNFNKIWSPRHDYSLLYDTKYINNPTSGSGSQVIFNSISSLNPLVFNNNKNIHILGRMLTDHLFATSTTPEIRGQLLIKWIKIGCKFEELGNMVSWLAIATVICSMPILRLSKSWNFVDDSTLKTLFRDWIPTIAQLDRRQLSSKSINSVFILAPPNLDDQFIKENVISYFGDLIIHADELPNDSKFKYLDKKINRTKNAFHKWEQRLQESSTARVVSTENGKKKTLSSNENLINFLYQYWKYHSQQESLSIDTLMKYSIKVEPPILDQKIYSKSGSQRSPLLSGSYLPILFNTLFENYSLFTKNSLIGAAETISTSHSSMILNESLSNGSQIPPPRSSARLSKTISISQPLNVVRSSLAQSSISSNLINLSGIDKLNSKQITGFGEIDNPVIEEFSNKHSNRQSNKQRLMKSIRDMFNIDMNIFHISDDLIFKSIDDSEVKSRTTSMVIESTKRLSQLSISANNNGVGNYNDISSIDIKRDSQITYSGVNISFDNLDFFNNVSKFSDTLNESVVINIVLKSSSLDKLYDLLILTVNILSKLVDSKDLESYYNNRNDRNKIDLISGSNPFDPDNSMIPKASLPTDLRAIDTMNIGLLDHALVKLSMDNTVFTETFFNTYKSFTTTISVIENLAKRFIKAKDCSVSIAQLLSPSYTDNNSRNLTEQSFPNWDMKVSDTTEINYVYMIMVHVGIVEAMHHMVRCHYADFTDDLLINSTFLDFFKIIDEEVTVSWPSRMKVLKKNNTDNEQYEELKKYFTKLETQFEGIKICYQKQLYTPVSINKSQRISNNLLNSFSKTSYSKFSNLLKDTSDSKNILSKRFLSLKINNYEDIMSWINDLDTFITGKFRLITKDEWFIVYQQIDILPSQSLLSLFNYPLLSASIKLLSSGSIQLDELEISNIFVWMSTLKKQDGSMFFVTLPSSVQLLIKIHASLTSFFTVMVSNTNSDYIERLNTCCVLLQILNYVHWKNSSLNLFDSDQVTHNNSHISPHIPSFIESSITTAIIAPESRNYELTWRAAHSKLQATDKNVKVKLKSIYNILDGIDDCHIKSFLEIDMAILGNSKNLCPCPGWFISRLLEISQFVPNMSIMNSKLINFDKRRFVNNIISNVLDLVQHIDEEQSASEKANFGNLLYSDFINEDNSYRQASKSGSLAESKIMNFQETGLFNELLINEVEKLKREQRKLELLFNQDRGNKTTVAVQRALQKNRRNSVIIPNSYHLSQLISSHGSNSTSITNRGKRGSVSSLSSRNSMISNQGHVGVSKKLGDFFKSPFSISSFSSSSSNSSLNSYLIHDLQSDGSLPPSSLPPIDIAILQDTKPVLSLKTFEIKSIVPIVNHRMSSAYAYSFKIVMQNGSDHMIQAASAKDLGDWIAMIKTSKRYSFYSKKFKGKTHNKIFGVPLEDVCEREGILIPTIVSKLLKEIDLRGLDEVGLYRIPGSAGSINALKYAFDEKGAVHNTFTLEDDRWFEINAIAGCFKMYLRELPDSLFTNEKVEDFARTVLKFKNSQLSEKEYVSEIVNMLNALPDCYYQTMKIIVYHLNKVHQHVGNNRMDAFNLAIVFSMSFINQDDLASSMGTTLGAIQTILQTFIKSPEIYFIK